MVNTDLVGQARAEGGDPVLDWGSGEREEVVVADGENMDPSPWRH